MLKFLRIRNCTRQDQENLINEINQKEAEVNRLVQELKKITGGELNQDIKVKRYSGV